MSQKWIDKEYSIVAREVEPGTISCINIVFRPDSRPFRVLSVTSSANGFYLAQCSAGKHQLVKTGSPFPATGLFGTAEAGEVVTITIKNTSDTKKDFEGKVVGQELAT